MVQQFLDRLSADPALWGFLRRIAEAGFLAEQNVIARELAPWRDPGRRRFLDFGCGTGESAAYFPPGSYVGIDIARHYVQYAGRHRTGRYAVMSGAGIGFAPASFDGGLVLGVFHHMSDDLVRTAIADLHRVLRPGATLLVMEDIPSPRPWNVAGHLMHWLDRGDHIRRDDDYRVLMEPYFSIRKSYTIVSGICDLVVYVLDRAEAVDAASSSPARRHQASAGETL
ncbi:MAG: class I SAM-dependent methyltransferase [Chloroflexi bacterium]|nr:class I SAM-dependent methyltransferase [Chloroflexota bacterium]